jgi:aminoglycoside 2'-N-acetyltransferase I
VLARAGSVIVGHASVVERPLAIDGRWHRAGYVEAVAVSEPYRRRGLATRILRTAIPALRGFDLGALSTGSPEVYARLGWQVWRGPTFAATSAGIVRTTDDDGGIMVLAQRVPLDLDRPIMCQWRTGDVW